jgi:hypothetical protein
MSNKTEMRIGKITIIHYNSPFGNGASLCCDDLQGDHAKIEGEAYETGKATHKPVNCKRCKEIVAYVRKIIKKGGSEK